MLRYVDLTEEYYVLVLASLKKGTTKRRREEDEEWEQDTQSGVKSTGSGNHTHPEHAVKILREWIYTHHLQPYPTNFEKQSLLEDTGLTMTQLNDWFSNARRRILKKGRYTRPSRSKLKGH